MGLVVKACDETAGGAPMAQHPNTTKSQTQKKKTVQGDLPYARKVVYCQSRAVYYCLTC